MSDEDIPCDIENNQHAWMNYGNPDGPQPGDVCDCGKARINNQGQVVILDDD